MRLPVRDFLVASLACLLCLGVHFSIPLVTGKVSANQARPHPPEALVNMSEMVFEILPALFVQARQMQHGIFPSWDPHSHGGTPLIGKMQNGIFAPHHLPLYVLPLSLAPYTFMLVAAIKIYLTFIFTYLYVRALGLSLAGGIFAATVYSCSGMMGGGLFSWGGTGPYLPLLLLLAELHLSGHERLVRVLWPWAVAFAFFAGHFETAFFACLIGAVYFAARLWHQRGDGPGQRARGLAEIAGLCLWGIGIAAIQILPALEYVRNSLNRVFHSPEWFTWWFSMTKSLTREDGPALVIGIGALAAFARMIFRRPAVFAWATAALFLALGFACLSQVGLDDSLAPLALDGEVRETGNWIAGFFLLSLAVWGWLQGWERQHPARMLGYIMLGGLLLKLRLPPLPNLLAHLPVFCNLHNTSYRWDFNLASAVLSAFAMERCFAGIRGSREARGRAAIRTAGVLCVFLLGYMGSQPLKGLIARRLPTSATHPEGGFMGPERLQTFFRSHVLAGWLPASPSLSSVRLIAKSAGKTLSTADASMDGSPRRGRRYFSGTLPLPETGDVRVFAEAEYADRPPMTLPGPEIRRLSFDHGGAGACGVFLSVLAFPLVFLLPRNLLVLPFALFAGFCATRHLTPAIAPDQVPYRLPGIARIKEDAGMFRTTSLQHNFLAADYPSIYGLSDFRPWGDNLGVLAMHHFYSLSSRFWGRLGDPAAFDIGLRLMGLANVKYLMYFPGTSFPHPSLAPCYRGEDMEVLENRHALPRASFYADYELQPIGGLEDWGKRDRILDPIARRLTDGGFDIGRRLLLHDPPSDGFRPSGGGRVSIERYSPTEVRLSVEAGGPGLVFLGDNFFPGWRAFLNGRRTRILRSWIAFRAVEVPAGKSVVVFSYASGVLAAGVLLSVCAAVAWIVAYRRYRLDPGECDPVASLTETSVMSLVAPALLFWLVWSAGVYRGGIQNPEASLGFLVNVSAAAVLAACGCVNWGGR